MGPVVVGTVAYRHLTVANDSICDLQYKLLVEQFVSGPYGDDEPPHDDDDGNLGMNSLHLTLFCGVTILRAKGRQSYIFIL